MNCDYLQFDRERRLDSVFFYASLAVSRDTRCGSGHTVGNGKLSYSNARNERSENSRRSNYSRWSERDSYWIIYKKYKFPLLHDIGVPRSSFAAIIIIIRFLIQKLFKVKSFKKV